MQYPDGRAPGREATGPASLVMPAELLSGGDLRIPTQNEMHAEWGVARTTARRAVAELRRRELIYPLHNAVASSRHAAASEAVAGDGPMFDWLHV